VRFRLRFIVIVVLALLFFGAPSLIRFYTDWLWFGEVGYQQVFTTIVRSQASLFTITFVIAVVWLVFNLRLAQDMEKALKDAGFTQTHLLITRGRGRAQLFTRPARAQGLGADVFVSIHHNDVQDQYKQKWEHNGGTYEYSDQFSGHSLFISRENARFADSLLFGRLLGLELKSRGLVYTRHHLENVRGERRQLLDADAGVYRYDRLVVLMYNKAPAVLVEAGIIVNRADEITLEQAERRAIFAEALVGAAQQYCGIQQARQRQAARKRK